MRLTLLLSFLLMTLFYGCERCKSTVYCDLPVVGKNYFGMYTEGSYWVYYNQDSSKVDSLYISNYENKYHQNNKDPCIEWNDITFDLIGEHLSNDDVKVSFGSLGSCETGRAHFRFNEGEGIYYGFEKGDKELRCSSADCEVLRPFELRDDPKYLFYEVSVYDNRYWFAPNVGLVKYVSHNKLDTFYLDTFVIK